jgi:hypothetical protein
MKKVFFLLLVMIIGGTRMYGQRTYVIGLKINPSLGQLRSPDLNQSFEAQRNLDPQIDTWNSHSRLRANFGFGGFGEYYFSGKIAVLVEPTFNFSNTKILIHKVTSNSISAGKRDELRISSEASIHISYVNLPVLAKFVLNQTSRFYVVGGVAVNLMFKPKLTSKETSVHSYWTNNGVEDIIDSTIKVPVNAKATLNHFNPVRFNLVLGAGKMFRLNGRGRNLYIDIRYSLPLTKSQMYTNGSNLDSSLNNRVFSYSGKADAEASVPGRRLNDFRLSVVTLSLSYTLTHK